MRAENLKAIQPKAFKPKTTHSAGTTAAPNLLAEIKPEECAPTKTIIGDITYIRVKSGKFAYLAVWQDKITRRIGGWSLSLEMTAESVISALHKTIRVGLVTRRSDYSFGSRLVNMPRTACAFCCSKIVCANQCREKAKVRDNAQAESFFSRCKAELIEEGVFEDLEQARSEIFSDIEGYYNRVRLHSGLGYKSPIEFEQELQTKNGGIKRQFFGLK